MIKINYMRIFLATQNLLSIVLISFLLIACKQVTNTTNKVTTENSASLRNIMSKDEGETKYHFRFHLNSGDKYYYNINTYMHINVEFQGKKVDNSNASEIGLVYKVISDTADKYVIQVIYKKMHTLIKKGDVTQEMDADNKYSFNASEKLLSALKDRSFFIIINKKGELITINGYRELTNQIISQLQISDEAQKQQLENQLNGMFGENFVKDNLTQEENMLPSSILQTGDTWTKNTTQSMPIFVSAITQYKLENTDNNRAKISASARLISNSKKNTLIMGTQVTANLQGKSYTDYHLAISSGMITNEKSKTNLKGEMQVMGRDIPVEIIIDKTVSVTKI